MNQPALFNPLAIGPIKLANRIVVSPMCQYSAVEGCANEWHHVHLGNLAISGAGLLCIEATAVSSEGRITYGCLGLYDDENESALRDVLKTIRCVSEIPVAIQLGHAGRKASSQRPWDGGNLILADAGGWPRVAPSAIAQKPEEAAPMEMSKSDIDKVIHDFSRAAQRASAMGFDAIELHVAHGYLLHQFLSPLSNRRNDEYGGSLDNRMRLPLEILKAVRDSVRDTIALGVRISATDWVEGGWDLEQSRVFCRKLEQAGCDFIDVSSGGLSSLQKIPLTPGYQVGFAEEIKNTVAIPVIAVGLITDPQQAEDIVKDGKADAVALARAFLNDPRWPWRAAAQLGGTVTAPKQFLRALPHGSPPIFGGMLTGQR